MENATKAIIISASALISIMILTFMMYIFSIFRGMNSDINDTQKNNEILKFNLKFLQYAEPDVILNAQDIITITNLASDNNEKYNLQNKEDGAFYITITIKRKENATINNFEKKSMDEKMNFIKDNNKKYRCEAKQNKNTSRISEITIQEI